ncbi:serine/threonine-protein kinase [Nonomuraea thailandensis]|uniref:Serine/threonine-protein kinase n=1 Tax=Nonomuraea thailandensis TaxID=1188745 RepID=A0A9X2GKZ4_9ACTN|nr:serine/threonine-protein kinase [Nonomuraea thailandensis]MCP2359494.1 serine/threonine-protein kinase [Nonomuraea thailandensis]
MVADRYRLDERIGSGPMGEVWRGYDTRADWVVAVKVLGARAAGAATREVLRQHAQAVARVIHPNVAMVLDVGDHEGAPFLVMEYLVGLSLGEELAARGPMKIVEVCDLIGQAAAGLDAAHRAGVVHGRVGPDSFRQAASGVLKVVGFGMDERGPAPAASPYVAPERAAGEPAQAPGDVYALGCVCYELLCGRPPFEDGAPGREAVAPSAIRREVPPELDRLVLAMLAEDPARRPASGEAIRRALAAIARPKPGPAGSPVTGVSLRDPGLGPGAAGAMGAGAGAAGAGGPGAGPGGNPGAGNAPTGGYGSPGQGATEVFQAGALGGAPPRAGDTAVFQAADLEPEPPSSPNRKLIVQLGVAVVVIAAATVGMVLWAGAREEPQVAQSTPTVEIITPSATPSTLPPSPEPSQDPVVTAGPGEDSDGDPDHLRETSNPRATLGEEIPPGGYAKWLQEFDAALMAQQGMGGINPEVAGKAREKLRKAAKKFGEGKPDATLGQIADIYRDLTRAQERGDMAPEGPAVEFMGEWRLPSR